MTWFQSYVDLLKSLKLFHVAAEVIKLSPDREVRVPVQHGFRDRTHLSILASKNHQVRSQSGDQRSKVHLYCSMPGCGKQLASTRVDEAGHSERCIECQKVRDLRIQLE